MAHSINMRKRGKIHVIKVDFEEIQALYHKFPIQMFRNTSDYDFVVEELECYVTSEYLYNYIKKINQYTNLKFHEIGAATKR